MSRLKFTAVVDSAAVVSELDLKRLRETWWEQIMNTYGAHPELKVVQTDVVDFTVKKGMTS